MTQLENQGKKPSPRLQNQIDSLQSFKTDLQQNLADFEKRVQESIGRQKPTTPAAPPVDPRIAAAEQAKERARLRAAIQPAAGTVPPRQKLLRTKQPKDLMALALVLLKAFLPVFNQERMHRLL